LASLLFIFIQQKTPTSIGGEMNAILITFSVGVQTPTEIEELSLRTPRPVATTEWPTSCCCRCVNTTLSRKKHLLA